MPELYFIETPAAGRLAIMPAPQPGDFPALRRAGLDLVVSLLPKEEAGRLRLGDAAERCRRAGMDFLGFPIRDFEIPEDFEPAARLVEALADQIAGGDAVALHCRAGIGRSGMMASAVMVGLGSGADEAMAAVGQARGFAIPETQAQVAWIHRYAAYQASRVTGVG